MFHIRFCDRQAWLLHKIRNRICCNPLPAYFPYRMGCGVHPLIIFDISVTGGRFRRFNPYSYQLVFLLCQIHSKIHHFLIHHFILYIMVGRKDTHNAVPILFPDDHSRITDASCRIPCCRFRQYPPFLKPPRSHFLHKGRLPGIGYDIYILHRHITCYPVDCFIHKSIFAC